MPTLKRASATCKHPHCIGDSETDLEGGKSLPDAFTCLHEYILPFYQNRKTVHTKQFILALLMVPLN